ncbi:hypothetical protein P2318_01955 [Myxococcaceae bacterium GXIMD 01537]
MTGRWCVALVLLLGVGCASTRTVRLETGPGRVREYAPPTWDESVRVEEGEFQEALARLVLEMPLPLRPAPAGRIVRASAPVGPILDETWRVALHRDYGRWCRANEGPGDCLSLLEEGLRFGEMDRLTVALGLAFDPMREGIAEAVEETLSPTVFYTVVVTGLASWVALLTVPEPVVTKAAAVLAVVMVAYLGIGPFLDLVRASFELKQATDRARTFTELEVAGTRFGRVLGREGGRILIAAATMLLGQGSAALAARLPLLPNFVAAEALGAAQVGLRLSAAGQVSAVSVVEGGLTISLAPTAVAMAAMGPGGGAAATEYRSWGSYSGLRKALGSAGKDKQWHHIVEQTPGNVERFGPHALHNTRNVIPLDEALHVRVSSFYSSIQFRVTGSTSVTVRQWLRTQSYEAQREFGLLAIENILKGLW